MDRSRSSPPELCHVRWSPMTEVTPVAWVSTAAVEVMAREARASADGTETGGIVLGRFVQGGVAVRVAGGPGPDAQRERHRFSRDLRHAQRLADAAWAVDGSTWVGEWHTHFDGLREPSTLDLHTYLGHLRDREILLDRFVALIVTSVGDGWDSVEVNGWLVSDAVCRTLALCVADQPRALPGGDTDAGTKSPGCECAGPSLGPCVSQDV